MAGRDFVRVAAVEQVPRGAGKVVYFCGREVAIYNVAGRFFAVDNLCPHRQAALSTGTLSPQGVVTCPWHGARFDVRTGKGLPGPHQCDIRTYAVRVVGREIHMQLPDADEDGPPAGHEPVP